MLLTVGILFLFSFSHGHVRGDRARLDRVGCGGARSGVNDCVAGEACFADGSHHTAPMSGTYKRCDVDGSGVIVPSRWALAHDVPGIAQDFPALPEKLSFLHLSFHSLRGPPPFKPDGLVLS